MSIGIYVALAKGSFALVDREDYEETVKYSWRVSTLGYAVRYKPVNRVFYLHRVILNIDDENILVDHRNHDTLDCRKSNLRICTRQENARNQKIPKYGESDYKGVSYHKHNDKWVAIIGINGKRIYLGSFTNQIDAAKEYDKAAIKFYGEYALTNFRWKVIARDKQWFSNCMGEICV